MARSARRSRPALEVWGGVECTRNRVGDSYLDQLELSGHDRRLDDLDRFAALGIRTLRYPLLWERTAPDGPASADWRWADERLERLRTLGIRPIVGLVHHGSGPPSTSLLDPAFPDRLAEYAAAVAARYPWVRDWTPINEPLTTARFSCLYGHWYPHHRDDSSFARAVVNQCRAVVLSMRAIRATIPNARLVQTDDLGKTYSTPRLAYQADLENARRWLTWDLLTGRRSPMEDWLVAAGVGADELAWFRANRCPPDVVGVNHYLSGERFLDHRVERYPPDERGGNGRDDYADVLALRVLGEGVDGPEGVLREAWQRYGLPIAVTEAHNGCTREEQLRWLDDVWTAAARLRVEGADVRAVCVWSLLGTTGWASLCANGGDVYEPGVFEVRDGRPRPTALATMVRALANEGHFDHPVLGAPGWWRRRDRLWYPPEGTPAPAVRPTSPAILVAGAQGTLGRAFARACEARGLVYRLLSRAQLDVADGASVDRALDAIRPWAVVNATGYVRVDDAERERARCFRENADGPAVLAERCAVRGTALVCFSSDLVFAGDKPGPYVESDTTCPLSVYGESKAAGEERALAAHPDALVVRTSAFFGPHDPHNFVAAALAALARGEPFPAAADTVVSPTYVPDLVDATLDLLVDGERGIAHLANRGAVTWAELARQAAELARVGATSLVEVPQADLRLAARRPRWSPLASERGFALAPLEDALARDAAQRLATGDTSGHASSVR